MELRNLLETLRFCSDVCGEAVDTLSGHARLRTASDAWEAVGRAAVRCGCGRTRTGHLAVALSHFTAKMAGVGAHALLPATIMAEFQALLPPGTRRVMGKMTRPGINFVPQAISVLAGNGTQAGNVAVPTGAAPLQHWVDALMQTPVAANRAQQLSPGLDAVITPFPPNPTVAAGVSPARRTRTLVDAASRHIALNPLATVLMANTTAPRMNAGVFANVQDPNDRWQAHIPQAVLRAALNDHSFHDPTFVGTAENNATTKHWRDIFRAMRSNQLVGMPARSSGVVLSYFRSLQDLNALATFLVGMGRITQAHYPFFNLRVILAVVVEEGVDHQSAQHPDAIGSQTRILHVNLPLTLRNVPNYQARHIVVTNHSTPLSVARDILNAFGEFFQRYEDQYEKTMADVVSLFIRNVVLIPEPVLAVGQMHVSMPTLFNATSADIAQVYRQQFANANPPSAISKFLHDLRHHQLPPSRSTSCLLDALLCACDPMLSALIPMPDVPAEARRNKRSPQQIARYQELEVLRRLKAERDGWLEDATLRGIYQQGNVERGMEEFFKKTQRRVPVYLAIISWFQPSAPSEVVEVTWDSGALNWRAVARESLPMLQPLVCLHQGHALCLRRYDMEHYFKVRGGSYARMTVSRQRLPPTAFVLKPDDPGKFFSAAVNKYQATLYNHWTDLGYRTVDDALLLSFDCETGRCARCVLPTLNDDGPVEYAHHACVLSVALSYKHVKSFTGYQCAKRNAEDPAYRGCVDSFIDWLEETYEEAQQVWIYSFNGSKFDTYLILQALVNRKAVFECRMNGGKIVQLTYGQKSFLDFRCLYPGSLADVWSTFVKSPHTRLLCGPDPLPVDKYSCFPYRVLDQEIFERVQVLTWEHHLSLSDQWWAGKRAPGPDTLSTAMCNTLWWGENVGPTVGELDVQALATVYCESDVTLLQLCAAVHNSTVALVTEGPQQKRYYHNTIGAATIGSAAIKIFRTCFLDPEPNMVTSHGLETRLPLKLHCASKTVEYITLGECVTRSLHGADTYQHRRAYGNIDQAGNYVSPSITGSPEVGIVQVDINSSYPAIMLDREMPTRVTGWEVWTEPRRLDTYEPNSLYWVKVVMQPLSEGLSQVFMSTTISPLRLEPVYYDPGDDLLKMHWVWGSELSAYAEWGADIRSFGTIRFHSTYLFRDYIHTFYRARLIARGRNPDTLQKDSQYAGSVNEFVATVLKNYMNNTFGKTAQADKPTVSVVYDLEQMIMAMGDFDLADVKVVSGPTHDALITSLFRAAPQIGHLNFIASKILSGGREVLARGRHGWQQFKDLRGDPALVICGDTDSMMAPELMPCPEAMTFMNSICHDAALGKWKIEAVSKRRVVAAGKKMYSLELDAPDAEDPSSHVKQASKGVPRRSLSMENYREMVFEDSTIPVPLPTSFQAEVGHLKEVSPTIRLIKAENKSRRWPVSPDGGPIIESVPWVSLEEFLSFHAPEVVWQSCSFEVLE